jgi:hypothetical protein
VLSRLLKPECGTRSTRDMAAGNGQNFGRHADGIDQLVQPFRVGFAVCGLRFAVCGLPGSGTAVGFFALVAGSQGSRSGDCPEGHSYRATNEGSHEEQPYLAQRLATSEQCRSQ